MENKTNSSLTLPGAIIIAGAMVALSIMWVKKPVANTAPTTDNQQENVTVNLSPITADDHILGNPNATIRVVEFSDTSCPYCKEFNKSMVEVMKQFGDTGKVAWVYRHYPLDTPGPNGSVLHPNSNKEAQALECAAEVSNTAFWNYEKKLYEVTPAVTQKSPQGLDPAQLPEIAKEIGLDVTSFKECLASNKYNSKVKVHFTDGINAGVSGTPTSFFVLGESVKKDVPSKVKEIAIQYKIPEDLIGTANDGKIIVMRGALPSSIVSAVISKILE